MPVYNDYVPPPPPEPNPYPFKATLPAGAQGEHVPLFKVTQGAALDLPARPFQYAVEVDAMFAGPGEDPERLVTAFACACGTPTPGVVGAQPLHGLVSRVAGYHTHRELATAHWDGTALVVSIVRPDTVARVYTGFITSKRMTHATSLAMLA